MSGGAGGRRRAGVEGRGWREAERSTAPTGYEATHHCGNCDAPYANRKCTGCGVEYYCSKECQTVRAVWWKSGYCV